MYNEINGDLIALALGGKFDVIAHGCNCFCLQGTGIAKQMNEHFITNNSWHFSLEHRTSHKGNINKLGQIQFNRVNKVIVVNAYTQYQPGANIDYEALTLCMRKMNHEFKGKHIGLPQIGCGIAGGNWNTVREIIKKELKDCKVTVVIYNKKLRH